MFLDVVDRVLHEVYPILPLIPVTSMSGTARCLNLDAKIMLHSGINFDTKFAMLLSINIMRHMRINSNEKFVLHSGVNFDANFMMQKFAMPLSLISILMTTLMMHIRFNSRLKFIPLRCEDRDAEVRDAAEHQHHDHSHDALVA